MNPNDFDVVKDFLALFYYPEISFHAATSESLDYFDKFPEYKIEVSNAFYKILEEDENSEQVTDLVSSYANRLMESPIEAWEFLYEVFKRNVLDIKADDVRKPTYAN
jgi:hypothetical protein